MQRKPMAGKSGRSKPAPRSAARRAMTPIDIERIRELVRAWPSEPFTWQLVCERVVREIQKAGASGKRWGSDASGWSRQALSGHPQIKEAYDTRKDELRKERERGKKNPFRNRDPEIVVLRRDRDGLRIKIAELEAKLSAYEERFQTVLYNQALGATDANELLRPLLPKIDRLGRD